MNKVTLSALEKLYADRVIKQERNLADVPASLRTNLKRYVESESQAESKKTQAQIIGVENADAPVKTKSATRCKKKTGEASKG